MSRSEVAERPTIHLPAKITQARRWDLTTLAIKRGISTAELVHDLIECALASCLDGDDA